MTEALLQHLRSRSNHRGLVIVRAQVLEDALHASFEEVHHALVTLEREKHLRILSPLPFLTVALPRRMWPGTKAEPAENAPQTGAPDARGHSYSFHNQSIESKAIAIEDGGVGEGETLLQEILAGLGESDPSSFRGVLEHYSPAAIRAVLTRVGATPPERVRKSRTALFRYLLAKSK